MSYNTEAFFDDVDNGTEYSEYDPGRGKWNTGLFLEKIGKISEVIHNSNPDIIALQEVENLNVLHTLCRKKLSGSGYSYKVLVPTLNSSTNTAILSRIPVQRVKAYSLDADNHEVSGRSSRKIIEIQVKYNGEYVYLFNNHWKSKLGGEYETEALRRKAAEVIITRLNEIYTGDPYADIIVLGDLNENTEEYIETGCKYQTALIPLHVKAPETYNKSSLFLADLPADNDIFSGKQGNRVILFETWYDADPSEKGSYVYKNRWQTPDHILLSPGLFHEKGFVYKDKSFAVMRTPFLLDPATGYPSRCYSDHLPLLITIFIQ